MTTRHYSRIIPRLAAGLALLLTAGTTAEAQKPAVTARRTATAITKKTSSATTRKTSATAKKAPAAQTKPTPPTDHILMPQGDDLTVVPALQDLAANLLKGRQGSIVALRPATGEVLCMVSNSLDGTAINRAIGATYAPGSTFKAAQTLTLFTEGIIRPDTKVACKKGFMMGGTHVGCHQHRSPLDMTQAIGQSCNSWFITNFMRMIADTLRYSSRNEAINVWHDYMVSYGFGRPTGIDLRGEASGIIADSAYLAGKYPTRWNEKTIGYIGMGQGLVTVSPIQLCNLAAGIANRGFWYTPYIHKASAAADPDKYITPHVTLAIPDAYRQVIAGMRVCVVSGTASNINTPLVTMCGKTGTAQNTGDDHSIFIAFAPMNDPQIAVCAYIEHGGDGNKTAAPIAASIIKKYLVKPSDVTHGARRDSSSVRKPSATGARKDSSAVRRATAGTRKPSAASNHRR